MELLLEKDGVNPNPKDSNSGRNRDLDLPSEQTSSGRGEGFTDLRGHLVSHPHRKIELRVNWELPEALNCYETGEKTRFSSILTISGREIDVQAATCENYLDEYFGPVGLIVLNAIQDAWDSKRRPYVIKEIEGQLSELSVNL
jgi:hypothetical protein